MKKARKPIDLYLITLFLLGGAAVVLRTVACFFEWNGVTMHFDDKVCITLGNVLVILAILLFSSHFILAKKGSVKDAEPEEPEKKVRPYKKKLWFQLFLIVIGCVMIVLGSNFTGSIIRISVCIGGFQCFDYHVTVTDKHVVGRGGVFL